MDDGVEIREARKEDCLEIRRLIQELADYEKMSDGPKIDANQLEDDGFGPTSFFRCFVATDKSSPDQLLGYVLFFPVYSTWEGKCLHMEDIYVTPSWRGKGVGTKLWKSVAREGVKMGCSRLNFVVLDWNKNSIDFYKNRGAVDLTNEEGWHMFRLNGDVMKALSDG